jgi:hypothetical protein
MLMTLAVLELVDLPVQHVLFQIIGLVLNARPWLTLEPNTERARVTSLSRSLKISGDMDHLSP